MVQRIPAPTTPDEGPLLLVVDDEPALLVLVGAMLRAAGYRVAVAGSGQEALNLVEELKPDAVLVDWMMPDMNGPQFAEHLQGALSPLLLITANTHGLAELDASTFDGVLEKPFSRRALLGAVEQAFERGR